LDNLALRSVLSSKREKELADAWHAAGVDLPQAPRNVAVAKKPLVSSSNTQRADEFAPHRAFDVAAGTVI